MTPVKNCPFCGGKALPNAEGWLDDLRQEIDRLRAENEKLSAALNRIVRDAGRAKKKTRCGLCGHYGCTTDHDEPSYFIPPNASHRGRIAHEIERYTDGARYCATPVSRVSGADVVATNPPNAKT